MHPNDSREPFLPLSKATGNSDGNRAEPRAPLHLPQGARRPAPQKVGRFPQKPKKAACYDHDIVIQSYKGKRVRIVHINGASIFIATLMQADRYSLLLRDEDTGAQAVFFKHAITSVCLAPVDAE